jgi:hypothetical protein
MTSFPSGNIKVTVCAIGERAVELVVEADAPGSLPAGLGSRIVRW